MLKLKEINSSNFESAAIEIFRHQYSKNEIYRTYCDSIKTDVSNVKTIESIPFLPIQFYKTHKVFCSEILPDFYFQSSGTSAQEIVSKHYVDNLIDYQESIELGFRHFFGAKNYIILGLLPHYLERPNSSLVYMVRHWMKMNHQEELFFLYDFDNLYSTLQRLLEKKQPILLIGLSSALIEFSKLYSIDSFLITIIETGGMKGKYPKMFKSDLFALLESRFQHATIISEYGMCELFSQAYSDSQAVFSCPPWMKMLVSDINDPLSNLSQGRGVAKVIDLANRQTCSFIETQDMINLYSDGKFEIMGRVEAADMRGCSLMYS